MIDEAPLPLPNQNEENVVQISDIIEENSMLDSLPIKIESIVDDKNLTNVPQTQLKNKEPLVVQGQGKTITIIPETNKNVSVKNTKQAETQFAFPEKYVEHPTSTTSDSCWNNMESGQMNFDVIKCLSKDQPNELSSEEYNKMNNYTVDNSETFLSTPDTSLPPSISMHQSPQKQSDTTSSQQMSLVPVAPTVQIPQNPLYTRQRSFKDK